MSRLRSQYVTVQLAQIGGLPAVVEGEDDGEVLLSLAVQAPAGLQRVLDRPVRIECVSARGIQRVTGLAAWSPEHPDQLRVAKAFLNAKNVEAARTQLKAVVEGYPGTAAATEAKDLLDDLK